MTIYAPNDNSQQVEFFEKITNKLPNYADENIMIGGDFNYPLTVSDKTGGQPVEPKKCVIEKICKVNSLYSLQDVWRKKITDKKQFTWRDKAYKVQCRLDYFLATPISLGSLRNAPGSDHCVVKAGLNLNIVF